MIGTILEISASNSKMPGDDGHGPGGVGHGPRDQFCPITSLQMAD